MDQRCAPTISAAAWARTTDCSFSRVSCLVPLALTLCSTHLHCLDAVRHECGATFAEQCSAPSREAPRRRG